VPQAVGEVEVQCPEEPNRVLCDHMSELLLCSSDTAAENMRRESARGSIEVVGDVMIDVAAHWDSLGPATSEILAAYGLTRGGYLLLTAHRAGNVDDPARLRALVRLVESLPRPIVFALHPRTRARLREAGLLAGLEGLDGLLVTEPLGYVEFGALLRCARAVLTDSGGVQKEAYLAMVPCVTLRSNTEWVETVDSGWNVLVDLDGGSALAALDKNIPPTRPPLYGDGKAAQRCVVAIDKLASRASSGSGGASL
jgi:UDP-GlcNAc3NAcA epimerase